MAKITLKENTKLQVVLAKLDGQADEICKKAVYAGANVMADQVRHNLNALPSDTFRYLRNGEKFNGVPDCQKQDLLDHFGVTPIKMTRWGDCDAKVGFDGYGSMETDAYPNGVPIPLLARSVESGSSVRQKTPFVRPAIRQAREKAKKAMADAIDQECEKIMK